MGTEKEWRGPRSRCAEERRQEGLSEEQKTETNETAKAEEPREQDGERFEEAQAAGAVRRGSAADAPGGKQGG